MKSVRQEEAAQLERVRQKGQQQVRSYLGHPDVARQGDVAGWLLTVVGCEVHVGRVDL